MKEATNKKNRNEKIVKSWHLSLQMQHLVLSFGSASHRRSTEIDAGRSLAQ